MRRPTAAPSPPGSLLGGIARLACFNAAGFAAIGNTRQAFLTSLSPLVAFALVGSVLRAAGGAWREGLGDGLQTLCVLLGQPVISHLAAGWFGRQHLWPRYASAMNWCQMALPVVGFALLLLAVLAGPAGPSPRGTLYALMGTLLTYAVALNVFLAWRGLQMSLWRAVAFSLLVTLGLAALLAGPVALRLVGNGMPPAGLVT